MKNNNNYIIIIIITIIKNMNNIYAMLFSEASNDKNLNLLYK